MAVVAALFLDESLSGMQYAGIAMISLGIMSLALTARGAGGRSALLAALAAGLAIATYTVIDGLGARSGDQPFSFVAWLLVMSAFPIGGIALGRRGLRVAAAAVRRQMWPGLLAGLVCGLAYAIVLWAYSRGTLAPIAALRETSVVFAALIGATLFGESFGLRRIVSAIVVAAGVLVLNAG